MEPYLFKALEAISNGAEAKRKCLRFGENSWFPSQIWAIAPLLRKPGGLPSWTESKLCPIQVSSLHIQATPIPNPPQTFGPVLLKVWFCRPTTCKKINWQCLFKMHMDLLEDLLDSQSYWIRISGCRNLRVKTSSFSNSYKHRRLGDTSLATLHKFSVPWAQHAFFVSGSSVLFFLFSPQTY